jgi:hypothetical protein
MTFDLTSWKSDLQGRFHNWRPRWQQAGTHSLYLFVAATALWPVAAALQRGDLAAVMLLGQLLANVGSNLLANVIQRIKDEADAPHQLAEALAESPALQTELDELLARLEALPLAQAGLNPADQAWFAATLRDELARLGNWPRFQAQLEGSGALAQGTGATAVGERGALISGHMAGPLTTGNNSPITYVGQQIITPTAKDGAAGRARRRYLEALYQRCNALPLAALGGEEGTGQDVGLDQVYIALDTRSRVPLSEDEQKKQRLVAMGREEKERALSVLEAVTQQPRLVLLGDPGSGKSSFVRYLSGWLAAAQLDRAPAPAGWPPALPLFMILRDLAPRLAALPLDGLGEEKQQALLCEAVWAQWEADLAGMKAAELGNHLADVLRQGEALLIFDGLDEVAESVRARVIMAVKATLRQYPQVLPTPGFLLFMDPNAPCFGAQ